MSDNIVDIEGTRRQVTYLVLGMWCLGLLQKFLLFLFYRSEIKGEQEEFCGGRLELIVIVARNNAKRTVGSVLSRDNGVYITASSSAKSSSSP
jgi:hypothetical protein